MHEMIDADGLAARAITASRQKRSRAELVERSKQETEPLEAAERERQAKAYAHAALEAVCGFRVYEPETELERFSTGRARGRGDFHEPVSEGFRLTAKVEGVELRIVPGFDSFPISTYRERIDGMSPPVHWIVQAFIPSNEPPESRKERKRRKKEGKPKPKAGAWRTLEDLADFGTVIEELA